MNTIPSLLPPKRPEVEATNGPAFLLRAVQKHWFIVLLFVALSLAGAAAYTSTRTRIFEATATVQLDPQPLMPLGPHVTPGGNERGPEAYWSNLEYFATQHQILVSRKIASAVVSKLNLNRDAAFLSAQLRPLPGAVTNVPIDAAAQILQARLKVKAISESRLASVSYADADPERAQRVLSTLLDVYVAQNLDSTLDAANKTAEWLDTQLAKLKQDLESQEMDLHDFKRTNNLLSVSFDDQSNMLRAQIQQLNTALTELKGRKEHVAARLAVLSQLDPSDPSNIPQSELIGDTMLTTLRERCTTAKRELLRLAALGKGENHPDIQAARAEYESAQQAALTELRNVREGAATDLAAVQRELNGVSTLYEAAKEQALGLNLNELRYSRLRRSKDSTERIFGLVLERSSESGLSKLMPFNNVRVLDRPLKPDSPISPRPLTNLAVGAAIGLLLGLAGALGRELLDRTVRSSEEVEQELGVPSLGSLPDTSRRNGRGVMYGAYYGSHARRSTGAEPPKGDADRPELLVHTHPKSAAAEAARAVCTNILFTSPDRPYRTLLVTSAGPAEGKTTVAVSIALGLSQTGRSVCLVDCDLRRPRIRKLFNLENDQGLTTALVDREQLGSAIHPTTIPKLSVVPSGPTPPNPADMMHSEAFGRVIEALKERFDFVVLDTPPACLVTDAVVASTRVDACVLVVRSRRTRRDAVRRALRTLQSVGANCTGFVMNAMSWSEKSYAYSYYGKPDQPEPTATTNT